MALTIKWFVPAEGFELDEFPDWAHVDGPVEDGPNWLVYEVTETVQSISFDGESVVTIVTNDGQSIEVEQGVNAFEIIG